MNKMNRRKIEYRIVLIIAATIYLYGCFTLQLDFIAIGFSLAYINMFNNKLYKQHQENIRIKEEEFYKNDENLKVKSLEYYKNNI